MHTILEETNSIEISQSCQNHWLLSFVSVDRSLVTLHYDFECFAPLLRLQVELKNVFLHEGVLGVKFIGFKNSSCAYLRVFREDVKVHPQIGLGRRQHQSLFDQ